MESPASIETAKSVLYTFGVILAAGSFSGLIAQKLKMPDIVVFLLVGMFLGPELTGIVSITQESTLNQLILIFGSCYILFDGGASLRFNVLKEVWITITIIMLIARPVNVFLCALPNKRAKWNNIGFRQYKFI